MKGVWVEELPGTRAGALPHGDRLSAKVSSNARKPKKAYNMSKNRFVNGKYYRYGTLSLLTSFHHFTALSYHMNESLWNFTFA